MTSALGVPAFVAAAAISLSTSSVLASRIERLAERLELSEALLGVVAALAADTPEITSAITAIASHQAQVGAGVVLGSGVFNLAALLGLGAVLAGGITLHRRVVALGGVVAVSVSALGLVTVSSAVEPWIALVLAVVVLGGYITLLAVADRGLAWLPLAERPRNWLVEAVIEEELELEESLRPQRGRPVDAAVAAASLVVVVVASVIMERTAASLGAQWGVPEIVVGALVLGGVTALPNAVASTYLARKGRGAASLSTALNSNNLNITIGLLIPAAVVGLGGASGPITLVAGWGLVLTVGTQAVAYRSGGFGRRAGFAVLAAYGVFVASVLAAGLA